MKRILAFAAILVAVLPASAETLSDKNVATSYSTVVDGWTYITNAAEFMLLASECQVPDVGPKKIRLACDIEYPDNVYKNMQSYYIKYFNGVFDGMGHTVIFKMLTSGNEDVGMGFIQELKGSGSEVCNLLFKDCRIGAKHSGTVALVVNKVTGENNHIHDIYVKGGSLDAVGQNNVVGGLVCDINSTTRISYCAFDGLFIRNNSGGINNLTGIFCTRSLSDNGDVSKCHISNCYMVDTPHLSGKLYAKFSCITDYTLKEYDKNIKRHENCFWDKNENIYDIGSNYLIDFGTGVISTVNSDRLKSGDNVLGPGWKYSENAMPEPEGLYYWKPSQTYSLNVGTYGSSQNLAGSVVPIEYGHFQDRTRLKLTSITPASSSTSYVISDNYTNELEIENPITAIASDVFVDIPMTTLQLPRGVTKVEGTAFRHGVTEGFISNGYWRYVGNLLYLTTDDDRLLLTSVGNNEELTINCQYCSSILSGAFTGQTNLKRLYVNTWFPIGYEGPYEPVKLLDTNIFNECPSDLTVYVKDGTSDQIIIGSNIDEGYKGDRYKWGNFYNEWDDDNNRLIQYFPVTRNPAGLSTLVLGFTVKLPADCWAWVATGISDNKLLLKRVGHVVPANLPVLLSYENKEGIMHLTPYEGSDVPASTQYDTENLLFRGSLDPAGQKEAPSEMQSNFLTLQLHPSYPTSWDKVGFYRFDGDILPSYVAWIPMSELPANAHLAMVFDGDYEFANPTGVTDVAGQADNASAPVYNLSGQRVGSGYRGMVIRNGRKYIAK